MTTSKIEMQDSMGNTLYPHTSGDIVIYDANKTVNQKIDETVTNLTNLKVNLATSINNKTGSSLTSDSTVSEMTSKIDSITTLNTGTSDATATAGQILSGSTAYVKGSKVTGTMANKGAVTSSLDCGGSYTIPVGYHNGSGKVTANSLASQTSANAVASDMLSGKTAYVNGTKITGVMQSMVNVGNNHTNATGVELGAYTSGDSNLYMYLGIPAWTYTADNTWVRYLASDVANKIGLTADKIVSGNSVLGVNGTATASKSVATLTLTDINLVTTTTDGSGLKFSVDLSAYLNGLSHYIVECNGTCYAYSTVTVASYAAVTPYSSFIKYKDSHDGDTFEQVAPDPTKIVFYRRVNSTYKCSSINFTVRITGF